MGNAEIRKGLMGLKKGDKIPSFIPSVGGCKAQEVVDYKLRSAPWRNILCRVSGTKIALELTGGENMIKLWKRVKTPLPTRPGGVGTFISFDGEQFNWQEAGLPKVAVDGEDEGAINYEVFVSNSDRAICVEWWPEEEAEAYELVEEIPFSKIKIH
jgi:hypothetical protein